MIRRPPRTALARRGALAALVVLAGVATGALLVLSSSADGRLESGGRQSGPDRGVVPLQDPESGLLPGHRSDRRRTAAAPPLLSPPSQPLPGTVTDQRRRMVERLAEAHRIDNRPVLTAMEEVPRHLFVPESYRQQAYEDVPLPMGWGQTVYQPYIVALMTSLADLGPEDTVLEIGTGSGYHTAVLSRVAGKVYSIEISEPIAARARERLRALGYDNIELRVGDGYEGWAEKAPFDAVILTAAPPHLPQPLIDQLKVGGKMVAPVGEYFQDLRVITKTADGLESEPVIPVRVSPMEGEVRDGEGR